MDVRHHSGCFDETAFWPINFVSDYEGGDYSPETARRPCIHDEVIRTCELCELLPVPRPWAHGLGLLPNIQVPFAQLVQGFLIYSCAVWFFYHAL